MSKNSLKLPPINGRFIRNFLTATDLAEVTAWAWGCIESGALPVSPSSKYRFSELVRNLELPDVWWKINRMVENEFNTNGLSEDPYVGFRLMYHTCSAIIYPHIDVTTKPLDVLRINILIHKPVKGGGMPVILDTETNLENGDLWAFVGNKSLHGCSMSDSDRIVLSFGYEF